MGKNRYLEKQKVAREVCVMAGLQSGRQQVIDMMSLVLRDPKIMGKDTFGRKRLEKIVRGIGRYMDMYQPAWMKTEETDYYRAKLDDALARAYGDDLKDSFMKRYEYMPEFDYKEGKWK